MTIDYEEVKCPYCGRTGSSRPTGLVKFSCPPYHEFECTVCAGRFDVLDGNDGILRLRQKEAIFSHPSLYRYYTPEAAEAYFKNGGYMLVPSELWAFALSVIYKHTDGDLREEIFKAIGEDLKTIKKVVKETEKEIERRKHDETDN